MNKTFDEELANTLCNLETPKGVKLSPDASKVLYSTTVLDGHRVGKDCLSTIWIASTDKENSARKLTSGTVDDCMPAWHPDGNQIVFLSDRGGGMAIWTLRLDGGDAVQLSPAGDKADINTFQLSPDGTKVAYISCDEATPEDKQKSHPDPDVYGESKYYRRLREMELEGSKSTCLSGLKQHVNSYCWSPDGASLFYTSIRYPDVEEILYTGTALSSVNIATSVIQQIYQTRQEVKQITVTQDGKLYYTSTTHETFCLAGITLYVLDTKLEAPTPVAVFSGEDEDVQGVVVKSGTVLATHHTRTGISITDVDGKQLFYRSTSF